ncbi:hypothetical protein CKA32_002229 [Geitlerinema sp. FC II]|nr:hypothetical protein [Geitlerinema sp. CS-897]PPT08267.1 hypothetical protein CKA32_002229 [Geitlerinema sp. FC II]
MTVFLERESQWDVPALSARTEMSEQSAKLPRSERTSQVFCRTKTMRPTAFG